ncbi:unnamed protein product [Chondrus crispus]|uniref:Uncharacterized protein n=1 Tax=Chondrus crispus TaxID=2769 RepID=R7Q645_CHOCR|nr:unnamed protein product [Chondrus crispus]CDF32940.1 unnamed protein product [Chondrus crispus]|eukprot:XP_005712743.1 unnamed protein product [Chondrus crispus]
MGEREGGAGRAYLDVDLVAHFRLRVHGRLGVFGRFVGHGCGGGAGGRGGGGAGREVADGVEAGAMWRWAKARGKRRG